MQGRKVAIIALGVLVLLLVVGGAYSFFSRQSNQQSNVEPTAAVIPTMKPEEIGLEFEAKADRKYVKFTINKIDGIEAVEYVISYDAKPDTTGSEGGDVDPDLKVTQSLTGDLTKKDIKGGKLGTEWRELGTCSTGGKCRFDKGVEEVNLLLKVTKSGDKVYQVEDKLTL